MKKLYIIKSNANGKPVWCAIGKNYTYQDLFSSYSIKSNFTDVTRFSLIEAVAVWIYLKSTHPFLKKLKIHREPLRWLE